MSDEGTIQKVAQWLRAKEKGQAVLRPDLLAKTTAKPPTPKPAPKARQAAPRGPALPRGGGPRVQIAEDNTQHSASALVNRVPVLPKTDAHDERSFSPCWCCGGPTGRKATYWGPWRQHAECARVVGQKASRLVAAARTLGLGDLALGDAGLLPVSAPLYSDLHPEPTWAEGERASSPWGQVDKRALVAAMSDLPRLRAEAGLTVSVCTSGRCAWCGRSESVEWTDGGHTWADGSAAPLCEGCARVYVGMGEPDPSWWPGQRVGMGAALTGSPPMLGESPPEGVKAFAEVAGSPESTALPDCEPWSHLPAGSVREYRFTTWARYGLAYCPPEHRVEVEAWVAERDRERAERMAEREAAEEKRLDVHGFGTSG